MSKKILVPTELSNASLPALELAAALAGELGDTIDVLHVLDTRRDRLEPLPSGFEVDSTELIEEMRQQAAVAVAHLEKAAHREVQQAYHTTLGDRGEEILTAAGDGRVEMVVMARPARGRVSRFLTGSVSEKVLRDATVPVLVVRTDGQAPLPLRDGAEDIQSSMLHARAPRRLLVAIELREESLPVLQYAAHLARRLDADLTIAHVIESGNPVIRRLVPEGAFERDQQLLGSSSDALTRFLEQHRDHLDPRLLRVPRVLAVGDPARQLEQMVIEDDADLLVVGHGGRLDDRKHRLGAVVQKLVGAATCPVLMVPRGRMHRAEAAKARSERTRIDAPAGARL